MTNMVIGRGPLKPTANTLKADTQTLLNLRKNLNAILLPSTHVLILPFKEPSPTPKNI